MIVSTVFYEAKKEYFLASDRMAIPYYMELELLAAQPYDDWPRNILQRAFSEKWVAA